MIDNDPTPATHDSSSSAGARQRAIEAYDGARERVSDSLGEAPLIALAGGLAAGALIAGSTSSDSIARKANRRSARCSMA